MESKDIKTYRVLSWNIAGFDEDKWQWLMKRAQDPADLIFLSETRCREKVMRDAIRSSTNDDQQYELIPNVHSKGSGLHGVAFLVRKDIVERVKKLPFSLSCKSRIDTQSPDACNGRILALALNDFAIVGTYVPNAGVGKKHLAYRTTEWDDALYAALSKLSTSMPAILWLGDLNVSLDDQDVNEAKVCSDLQRAGFTDAERGNFRKYFTRSSAADASISKNDDDIKTADWIDAWRHQHKDQKTYTHFGRPGKLPHETGLCMRLDYTIVSKDLLPRVVSTKIWENIPKEHSDHAPIEIEIRCF